MPLVREFNFSGLKPFADYQIIWLKSGTGIYEVDFQRYVFSREEMLFLAPDQYFRVISGEIEITNILVSKLLRDSINLSENNEYRVLFNHIIKVGSIEITPEVSSLLSEFPEYIDSNKPIHPKDNSATQLINNSVDIWLKQKPFKGITKYETDVIFDLKHIIDLHFRNNPESDFYSRILHLPHHKLQQIVNYRLELTPIQLQKNRLILEAERQLSFTQKTSKEITFELGFNDPAYFNRFFKRRVGLTTREFRKHYLENPAQPFINDLLDLINTHFKKNKRVHFYAEKLHTTPKSLSAKVKQATGKTTLDLIHAKVLSESTKMMKNKDLKIKDISESLGFSTPSQFSHFYHRYRGEYPTLDT